MTKSVENSGPNLRLKVLTYFGIFGHYPDKSFIVNSSFGPSIISSGPNTILDLPVL